MHISMIIRSTSSIAISIRTVISSSVITMCTIDMIELCLCRARTKVALVKVVS